MPEPSRKRLSYEQNFGSCAIHYIERPLPQDFFAIVLNHSDEHILVVGASGQLGTALIQQLGTAAVPAARRQLQPEWLHLDLEEIAQTPSLLDGLVERHQVTAILCCAGATNVDRCETDPAWAEAANHLGPLALAKIAATAKIPYAFFSTDYVFDGEAGPYAEDGPINPLSVYGRTKAEGEQSILEAHPTALVLRTTTVFGPDPQGKNFLYTLRRLLSAGQPMRLPQDQLATPTYVLDLATASFALLRTRQSGIFHIAGPDYLSRMEFAQMACGILGLDSSLLQPTTTSELKQAANRPLRGGLRIDKLRKTLPAITMRDTVSAIKTWHATQAS